MAPNNFYFFIYIIISFMEPEYSRKRRYSDLNFETTARPFRPSAPKRYRTRTVPVNLAEDEPKTNPIQISINQGPPRVQKSVLASSLAARRSLNNFSSRRTSRTVTRTVGRPRHVRGPNRPIGTFHPLNNPNTRYITRRTYSGRARSRYYRR